MDSFMAKSTGANKRNDENKIGLGIKLTFVVVALLCVVMLVYSVVDSTGMLDRNTTAMTVGEDEISVSELNMYYQTVRSNFLSQYGDVLMMYGYDYTNVAFDSQPCMMDTTMTWKQYFMEEAKASAQEISLLYQVPAPRWQADPKICLRPWGRSDCLPAAAGLRGRR